MWTTVGVVVALVLVAGGVWAIVAAWGREKSGGAVSRDNLTEAQKAAALKAQADEVKRNAPKTPRALVDWLRGRVRGRGRGDR